jgi:hypothetical protein
MTVSIKSFMLVLLAVLSVSSSRLVLNQTAHGWLPLRIMEKILIEVSPSPLLLVLPSTVGLDGTVGMDVNGTTIIVGDLAAPFPPFAVLFTAGGRLVVFAKATTYFEYFSIALSKPCPMLAISTAPTDSFTAGRDESGVNLTMTDDQDFCFFHIANATTAVSAKFSAEDLWFENSDASKMLSGDGSFEATSAPSFTSFGWTSEKSKFVELRFESNSTLPARRGNYSTRGTRPGEPIVIIDAAGRPAEDQYWNADREWYERPGNAAVTNVIVLAIGGCFGLMVSALAGVCVFEWGRKMMRSGDHEERIEILGVADMAGVQEQVEVDEKDAAPIPA